MEELQNHISMLWDEYAAMPTFDLPS